MFMLTRLRLIVVGKDALHRTATLENHMNYVFIVQKVIMVFFPKGTIVTYMIVVAINNLKIPGY